MARIEQLAEQEKADEEAADWLILLAEEPDDEEMRNAFENWRTASPLNAEVWARTTCAYDLIGHAEPGYREQWDERSASVPPLKVRPRRPFRPTVRARRIAIVTATGALVASVAAAAMPAVLLSLRADYSTGRAQMRQITLADGSLVRLAPESAIAVLGTGQRGVRVLAGEAWFDVGHDPARPFHVETRHGSITVNKAALDVRQLSDSTAVAVGSGNLGLQSEFGRGIGLAAGEQLVVSGMGTSSRSHIVPDEVGDRTHGLLAVRDRPASEIVDALRPWYKGIIVLRAPAFAAWRVSGLYDLRDVDGTLQALAMQHGATIRKVTPWVTIISEH